LIAHSKHPSEHLGNAPGGERHSATKAEELLKTSD
jgi:hypothetical protein